MITKRSNSAHSDILYLHKDNQGSTISITNASGNVVQQFIYDPWGKQYSVSSNSLFTTYSNPGDSKGYTGHKMINDFDVIHMGGRTYNPILGRFMQADPFIQFAGNLQSYNRYSYVLNNPMSYTDPSGYFLSTLWGAGKAIFNKVVAPALRELAKVPVLNAAVQIVGCVYTGPGCPYFLSAYNGAQTQAVTGSLRSALKSAAISYAAAYTFQQIGSHYSELSAQNINAVAWEGANYGSFYDFGGNLLTGGQVAAQIASHAVVGGVIAELQGSKFGHGFISAGFTKGAGGTFLPSGGNLTAGQVAYGTVVSAVIGGTVSELSGGKFANGANTAAFQYLFNQASKTWRETKYSLMKSKHEMFYRYLEMKYQII